MISSLLRTYSEKLCSKFYGNSDHPYKVYENRIAHYLQKDFIIVDAGCGTNAPVLQKLESQAHLLLGLDVCGLENSNGYSGIDFAVNDLNTISLHDNSVDMVISRSVLEHLRDPGQVFQEVGRILKPQGYFIFLTPNLFEYTSLLAKMIPNRYHSRLVKWTEGRAEDHTFPTYYRANTSIAVRRFAKSASLQLQTISYLGQYPSYLLFNPLLFLLGTAYDKTVTRFKTLKAFRSWILCVLRKEASLSTYSLSYD